MLAKPSLFLLLWIGRSAAAQLPLDANAEKTFFQGFEESVKGDRLNCRVDTFTPFLDFSFRYEIGYLVHCPVRQFNGKQTACGHPAAGEGETGPVTTLGQSYSVPAVPAEMKDRLDLQHVHNEVEFSGVFTAGEGEYDVQLLVFDEHNRRCRKSWQAKAHPHGDEVRADLAMRPGSVAAVSLPPWSGISNDGTGIRLTVLLDAAPVNPFPSKLHAWDRAFLLGALSSLLRQTSVASVRMIAFNLDQQLEVFRENDFDHTGLYRLSSALNKLELGTVSYKILQRRQGWEELLAGLMREETLRGKRSDAVVFLGPTSRVDTKMFTGTADSKSRTHAPLFYFQYSPAPGRDFPDTIQYLVSAYDGTTFHLHSPGDLARAIAKMQGQLERVNGVRTKALNRAHRARYDGSVVRRRLVFAAAAITFIALLILMVWQGSFSFSFGPDVHETIFLSVVSALIFIFAMTLAFMLFRAIVKLYMDRQKNREGSRIRSRLLVGALALTLAPTLFSALFNYFVLNRTLNKWFTQPARGIEMNLKDLDKSYRNEAQGRMQARANWIGLLPQTRAAAEAGKVDTQFFSILCKKGAHPTTDIDASIASAHPLSAFRKKRERTSASQSQGHGRGTRVRRNKCDGRAGARSGCERKTAIQRFMDEQEHLGAHKKFYSDFYFLLLCLLTLFVLFFAAWSAQILSRQISIPISALLGAAQEVRRGDLSYRVQVSAIDELATLVRAFNAMTSELEGNARELEARRQFTEAILESIPTGVISVSLDERIERVNRALRGIFSVEVVRAAHKLEDSFCRRN